MPGSAQAVLIPVLLPVVVALALVVAIAGSTPSIRAGVAHGAHLQPGRADALMGEAEPGSGCCDGPLVHRQSAEFSAIDCNDRLCGCCDCAV